MNPRKCNTGYMKFLHDFFTQIIKTSNFIYFYSSSYCAWDDILPPLSKNKELAYLWYFSRHISNNVGIFYDCAAAYQSFSFSVSLAHTTGLPWGSPIPNAAVNMFVCSNYSHWATPCTELFIITLSFHLALYNILLHDNSVCRIMY